MKSERRHELETNVLANRLGVVIDSGKPMGGLILGGLAAILVAAIGYAVYNHWTYKANSEAWTEFYLMSGKGDAEAFDSVVEIYPTSTAAPWARQAMGDGQLMRGIDGLYRNRSEGEALIGEAISSYKAVLDSTNEPELQSKATIGLAQAYESLGKLEEARGQYELVEKAGATPSMSRFARERIEWLKADSSKSFYKWFASLKPTPDAPPSLPGDLAIPPTTPDISFTPKENEPTSNETKSEGVIKLQLPATPSDSAGSAAAVPATSSTPTLLPSSALPTIQPPAVQLPAVQPPAIQPPTLQPPALQPPAVQAPAVQPPPATPASSTGSATAPSVSTPPPAPVK